MRYTLVFGLSGCVEYTLVSGVEAGEVCAATDTYVVCPGLVDHATAQRSCADLGATLLVVPEPYTREDVLDVVSVAAEVTDLASWVGMPTSFEFECPTLTMTGAVVGHHCAELRSFACSF